MGAFLMVWFLLYGGLAAAAFSFCYIGHKKIKEGTWLYDDQDSILFAVLMGIFWPVTIWFFLPYLLITLYKKD